MFALLTNQVSWTDLVALVVVTTPAIIAAVSSLRNGKKLNGGHEIRPAVPIPGVSRFKKKTENAGDWYKPPKLF